MKKIISLLFAAVLTLTLSSTTAFAINEEPPVFFQSESEIVITPYADVIVKAYRSNNGVIQYRRWNQTRGYWVDPYWINL
jgi:hypothetical protein